MRRLSTQIAFNTAIQIIGKIIAAFFGLLAIAIITRYLGQAGFGQFTIINTFLSFFAVAADLGFTLVTVQMISQPGVQQNKTLSNLFSLRLISAVILLALAPLVVIFFPYQPLVKIGIAITTLAFLFTSLNQIFVGLYQKSLRMEIVALAEVIGRLILLIAVALAAFLKQGLLGIMMATVLAAAINYLINYFFSRQLAKIKWQIDLTIWREILKKAWPLAVTIIFNLLYLRTDTLILSLFRSQAEVGIYGAAYKVVDLLTTLPFMFAGLILPILTKSWLEKDEKAFNRVLQKSFNVMMILALPLALATPLVAKPLMILIAGQGFALSGEILKILILATVMIFLGCLFAHAVIAMDKQKKIIAAYIFTAVTAVIGYLIFIPRFSYFGAAWVTVYSEITIALASFFLVIKYSQFKFDLNLLFKVLLSSLVMLLIIYLIVNKINLLLVLLVAMVSYFLTLYLVKGFSRQELLSLFNR